MVVRISEKPRTQCPEQMPLRCPTNSCDGSEIQGSTVFKASQIWPPESIHLVCYHVAGRLKVYSRARDRNFGKNFRSRAREHSIAVSKMLLSSGWTLIGSELSSPNFNSSVRAERYLNVVIKPLCGNLEICLNY